MIITGSRIEDKKPSDLILPSMDILETFPYVKDVDYIIRDLVVSSVRVAHQKRGRFITHRFRKSKYSIQVLSESGEILLAVIKRLRDVAVYYHFAISTFPDKIMIRSSTFINLLHRPIRVYFVEGLGHNLFLVGQFFDSDLEVAFRRNTTFVRNLEGVDLLKGNRTTNLYTINLHEMASTSPICLMDHATSTKSWLWHQRLSHLNFYTINDLTKNDLVIGLPKFKYQKEHLCRTCEQGKSKKASHKPKHVLNSKQRLHLLHMDLCGPMRVESINGKRSKNEAPEEIKTFLKKITSLLQAQVIIVRIDNGIEFKNQVLKEYFDSIGISHQASSVRTPQQNGVVERRNRTLVETARTMLIFSCALLFLWAEAIAITCYTQNRSIIHRRFDKTSYELINGKKPDISFLHVFEALCYPKNDREDIGKLGAKGYIGFFIGYSSNCCAFKVYNRRTKKIMEMMNVTFDELSAIAFEQRSSKLGLQSMTSRQISAGLDLTYAPSTITSQKPTKHASTTVEESAPTPTNSLQSPNIPNTSQDVGELPQQHHVQQKDNQALLQPETDVNNV
ncbi:retrovirus-related pol polyprotein from transposon TNT 1-94 [Tanacetum coccineum]